MNRAALFVAGGIPRCRLSPETFITARRPLGGISNVFEGGNRADSFRRFAESEIHIDEKKGGRKKITATLLANTMRDNRTNTKKIRH